MQRKRLNQTLALAGLFHATWLVRQVAHRVPVDTRQLGIALRPIFVLEPASIEAVYGDASNRHTLLATLKDQLGAGEAERDMESTRYAAALMHLERKLVRRRDLVQHLREGIEAAQNQLQHFDPGHENVVGRLSDLYSETISTLRPRIMVHGEGDALTDTANAQRVRALLLAGMRSAVLWRQAGGNRLKLVLGRQTLIHAAHELDHEEA